MDRPQAAGQGWTVRYTQGQLTRNSLGVTMFLETPISTFCTHFDPNLSVGEALKDVNRPCMRFGKRTQCNKDLSNQGQVESA